MNNNIGPEEIGEIATSTTREKIGHLVADEAIWAYIDPRVLWICIKRWIISNHDNYDFVDHVCMFTNCYGRHDLYRSDEEKEALILFLHDCGDVTYVPVGSLYIIE